MRLSVLDVLGIRALTGYNAVGWREFILTTLGSHIIINIFVNLCRFRDHGFKRRTPRRTHFNNGVDGRDEGKKFHFQSPKL